MVLDDVAPGRKATTPACIYANGLLPLFSEEAAGRVGAFVR
jgi:hypothetical protein